MELKVYAQGSVTKNSSWCFGYRFHVCRDHVLLSNVFSPTIEKICRVGLGLAVSLFHRPR